jgi:hypothetical protein
MPRPTSNVPTQGNAALDGGQFITELQSGQMHPPRLAQFLTKIVNYVNGLATSSANSGSGEITPPPPMAGMTVKTSGETVHVQHDHPGAIQRGVQYFTEVGVNDSGFNQPLVIDHGASRTSHPFTLPTNDDNGAPINYYFRSYAQYHGSKRSDFAYWGAPGAPTAVTLTGTTNLTPLPSKGSGTASNDGNQGGQGLGHQLFRPPVAPKRTVGGV